MQLTVVSAPDNSRVGLFDVADHWASWMSFWGNPMLSAVSLAFRL